MVNQMGIEELQSLFSKALSSEKKILILGGKENDYTLEMRRDKRVVLWYSVRSAIRQGRVPNDVGTIITTQFSSHSLLNTAKSTKPEDAIFFNKKIATPGNIRRVYEAVTSPISVSASSEASDAPSPITSHPDRISITEFIRKNGDLSASHVKTEVDRLHELGREQGHELNKLSITSTFYILRKKASGKEAEAFPPTLSQKKIAPTIKHGSSEINEAVGIIRDFSEGVRGFFDKLPLVENALGIILLENQRLASIEHELALLKEGFARILDSVKNGSQ